MHEAQMHECSVFVTLTYDDEHLPKNGSLDYGDFQKFMRRLRKKKGSCRFYMCGEYGDLNGRPHFHAALFGVDFEDREPFRTLPSGSRIWTSKELELLWPFGYSSLGQVTFESAAYIARYVCKKVTGEGSNEHYSRVNLETGEVIAMEPEFCSMSLKPGIGQTWLEKYGFGDVFPHDRVVMAGREQPVPRFYKQWLRKRDAFMSDDLDFERMKKAEKYVDDCTEARLAEREQVAKARLRFKKRGLEN
jgi:hypothetical protein